MTKGNIRKQKKRGRPPKPGGLDPVISARIPKETVKAIDTWGAEHDVHSRQEAVLMLIERGLKGRSR